MKIKINGESMECSRAWMFGQDARGQYIVIECADGTLVFVAKAMR